MGGFIQKSEQVNRAAVLFVRVRYTHPATSVFIEDTEGQKMQAALALTAQAAQSKREKAVAVFHVDWTGLGHGPVTEYENFHMYKVALDANQAELYNKPFVTRVNESFQRLEQKPEMFATDGSGAPSFLFVLNVLYLFPCVCFGSCKICPPWFCLRLFEMLDFLFVPEAF